MAFVQSNQAASGSATSLNCSFLSNVGASALVVTGARIGTSGRTLTVTDSFGTLAQAVTQAQTTDGHQAYIHYELNVAGGADTVTVAISGAAASIRYAIHEYSATVSALDQTNSAQWTTGSVDSGSVTTTQASELLFGLLTDDNAQSAVWSPTTSPSTWNGRESIVPTTDTCVYTDDLVVSSTGTYSNLPVKSSGLTNNGTTLIATFKVATAATAVPAPELLAHHPSALFRPWARHPAFGQDAQVNLPVPVPQSVAPQHPVSLFRPWKNKPLPLQPIPPAQPAETIASNVTARSPSPLFRPWARRPLVPDVIVSGVVFNDSGTGTITLSGSGTESHTHSNTASGSVTLSGSGTQSHTHSGSGSGTITLSGTGTQSAVFTDSRAGTITLSGSGTQSQTHTVSAAGTVTLSGAFGQSQTHSQSATGTVTLSGFGSENFVPPGGPTQVVNEYDQTQEILAQRLPH